MKKNYYLLLLLFLNCIAYCQNTTVTTEIVTYTNSDGKLREKTTETTTVQRMDKTGNFTPFTTSEKITEKDATKLADKTTNTVNNNSENPPTVVNYDIFKQDRIELVTWGIKDNQFQVTYFDQDGNLRIYISDIAKDGFISSKLGGTKIVNPFFYKKSKSRVSKANIQAENFAETTVRSEIFHNIVASTDEAGEKEKIKRKELNRLKNLIYRFASPPVSIVTVPIKIRPDIHGLGQVTDGSISSVGIYVPLVFATRAKIYYDGKISKEKFSFGGIVAPMIQTFNAANLNNPSAKEAKEVALSLGTALSYSYNDITFMLIPAGADYGLTSTSKSWIYQGRYWWGFGIALKPTILTRG